MAKKKNKKKHPHIDKSPVRKQKAKTWVKTYTGTNVVKDYRARFRGVDVACAVRELQEIGYQFEPGYVENVMRNEAARINQIHRNKATRQETEQYNDFQDDNFFYIAGYTSGGAPYGVQWWEMGLEPWESIDDMDEDDDEENDQTEGFVCPFCKSDITTVNGCTLSKFMCKNKEYERYKVGGAGDFFEDTDVSCGDCGSQYGHYHHYGCDCEHCPICDGQLITCVCLSTQKYSVWPRKSTAPLNTEFCMNYRT